MAHVTHMPHSGCQNFARQRFILVYRACSRCRQYQAGDGWSQRSSFPSLEEWPGQTDPLFSRSKHTFQQVLLTPSELPKILNEVSKPGDPVERKPTRVLDHASHPKSTHLPGAPCSAPAAPAACAHLPRSRGVLGGAHTLDRTTQTPALVGLSDRGIPGSRLGLPTSQRCKFSPLLSVASSETWARPTRSAPPWPNAGAQIPPRLLDAGY